MTLPPDPLADGLLAFEQALRAGTTTSRSATEAYLARIEALNSGLGAYRYEAAEAALADADRVDRALTSGRDPGPLAGLPIAIKDLFVVDGMPTGAGTDLDVSDIVGYTEGPLVRRLRDLGCVFLGKTRTVEFALGIAGVSSPHGTPRNPCDGDVVRIPGGSSSGSAVAAAAGLCAFAIGSDTGGSVRVPAALCGTTGIKPSQGHWSADGAFPLVRHLDTPGLLMRDPHDAALVAAAIDGITPTAIRLDRTTFAVPRDYFLDGLEPAVERAFERALEALRMRGASIREMNVLSGARNRESYFPAVLGASAVAVLGRERYAASRHLVDPVIRRRIDAGLEVTGDAILSLEWERQTTMAEAAHQLTDVDAILTPTAAITAPPLSDFDDAEIAYRHAVDLSRNSQPGNYLGLCGASVPVHRSDELPVGLQIMAAPNTDHALYGLVASIGEAISHAG
ncbi:aspartyl-tRNA(Asn)/glutamyl-tRNA(Gln) amidotransferase subunit A [Palleronia aestuarii]|uniref:Aspartyl-tRNA(Asn)/glutamyl-tRNA(Gln) amidotransferase subunit A n=2 Tax=Palleronia aestuarii TaxID=568105 RepID=A0A2W7NBX7_9RHOB|nr:aspartyl-tRNA(Asn)/glutamyl-tRNA(Gln) amidotransferase subunit A [Palleronia aestuarii]